jgi:7-keto-8-aminopelargonate synthetase-like enzyme
MLTVINRYGVALSIKEAYATGVIGKAFDCADNSGSVS